MPIGSFAQVKRKISWKEVVKEKCGIKVSTYMQVGSKVRFLVLLVTKP